MTNKKRKNTNKIYTGTVIDVDESSPIDGYIVQRKLLTGH